MLGKLSFWIGLLGGLLTSEYNHETPKRTSNVVYQECRKHQHYAKQIYYTYGWMVLILTKPGHDLFPLIATGKISSPCLIHLVLGVAASYPDNASFEALSVYSGIIGITQHSLDGPAGRITW